MRNHEEVNNFKKKKRNEEDQIYLLKIFKDHTITRLKATKLNPRVRYNLTTDNLQYDMISYAKNKAMIEHQLMHLPKAQYTYCSSFWRGEIV